MRIIVTASQAPFIRGGGERHVQNLCNALREHGHDVALLHMPFKFSPASDIARLMAFCDGYELCAPNGRQVDRVISLQFPCWGMHHPQHVVWMMHQHRAAYELFDASKTTREFADLRERIVEFDTRTLSGVTRRYANSQRVADRLRQYNGLDATALYHPPPDAEALRCDEPWNYVFFPSRLEGLKRQDLLIEAACHLRSSTKILLGGEGPLYEHYDRMIERYSLADRVKLIGYFSDRERVALFGHALAVVFPAFDEDLGYVPLEAMYAAKPVVTCSDSGGPLEFVVKDETGDIVEPSPAALADAIDRLAADPARAQAMGEAGRQRIISSQLSWHRVVSALCA